MWLMSQIRRERVRFGSVRSVLCPRDSCLEQIPRPDFFGRRTITHCLLSRSKAEEDRYSRRPADRPDGCNTLGGPGAWSRDGVILVSGLDTESKSLGALLRISSSGGEVKALGAADPSTFAVAPQFLPDGKHFLHLAVNPANLTEATLYLRSLESTDKVRVMTVGMGPGGDRALYAAPGYLLFKSNGTLMAQPFDANRGVLSGAPTPLAGKCRRFFGIGYRGDRLSERRHRNY